MLVVGNKAQWEKFCAVIDRPELPADARFASNQARIQHRGELNAILEPILLAQPRQHWIDALAAVGVPCGPVNELHEVFDDPQVRARGMLAHMRHPHRAAMPMLANPIRLSDTPVQYRLPPPALGQHTDEVLAELAGYDEARRRVLREAGVI
jgi:crotonobetainyl-CoA:carnitine CoA-transferase CaiB-like acyl-CoA transferase